MCLRISEKEVGGIHVSRDVRYSMISDYCWLNLEKRGRRVGKIRMKTGDDLAVVYSIMIYPEFQAMGYAGSIIGLMKNTYQSIIAHNVRYRAIGFWKCHGFDEYSEGHYIWRGY